MRVRDSIDRSFARAAAQESERLRVREALTSSTAAQAIGAFALGAVAIGALAIGALAIGRLAIGRARIRRLEIDELIVRRLRVVEQFEAPPQPEPES
jgi:hypothetical protein